MANQRTRKLWSVKSELITKAREAMLTAVQVFNNPNIQFKSETFIVLSIIAWTYLLHAYYRDKGIEYRYFDQNGRRKRFHKTKNGADKYWELERCLNYDQNPVDNVSASNLRFLIGLRHEVEHQMTTRIDDYLSARFQACCLNFNHYIKSIFGNGYGIEKHLSFSLQFSSITEEHATQLREFRDLPANISAFINGFDNNIPDEEYNDPKYAYRVIYVPKTVNHKGQADRVIEFLPANSPEAEGLNKQFVVIREREKKKYLPGHIVKLMKDKGFANFSMTKHTELWKVNDGKNPAKNFGVQVATTWYWYENWLKFVEEYCKIQYR